LPTILLKCCLEVEIFDVKADNGKKWKVFWIHICLFVWLMTKMKHFLTPICLFVSCGLGIFPLTKNTVYLIFRYAKALQDMIHILQQRQLLPWYKPDFIFNLSSLKQTYDESLRVLHSFTKKVIKGNFNFLACNEKWLKFSFEKQTNDKIWISILILWKRKVLLHSWTLCWHSSYPMDPC